MTIEEVVSKLNDFERAVASFRRVFHIQAEDEIEKDAAIQRFEYCYEGAWKLIKMYMTYKGGKVLKNPRDSFKEAFLQDLIDSEKTWLKMIDDRNLTVHTYDLLTARGIFNHLRDYCDAMQVLADNIRKQVQ
jgi:nucleotidyltransferase substrate binding protein (TIGR01987 family)